MTSLHAPSDTTLNTLSAQVATIEHPLDTPADLDPLLDEIGDARYVLLGEASHGTSDYYLWRARLSQRLITEKGFSFIAVEGDWPDCYQINRFIKGRSDAGTAADVLHAFRRWPTWMWANWEMAALVEWLRTHNRDRRLRDDAQIGFYGVDVYSLHESLSTILNYLDENVPEALAAAQQAIRCFEPYGEDGQAYAWGSSLVPGDCEDEVVDLLSTLRRDAGDRFDGNDPEAAFHLEQNARVAVNAERYYRTMLRGSSASWNVRDYHMSDTLDALMAHHGPDARAIVWEHNTHVGDARATDMARANMINVGQVARERHGDDGVMLVGFGSHRGTVVAAGAWGDPMEIMELPPARAGSWEDVLHQGDRSDKWFLADDLRRIAAARSARGHRAVGVVYHPQREAGNYVPTVLPDRYDAFLYIDETEALHPLHLEPAGTTPPETFPWGV